MGTSNLQPGPVFILSHLQDVLIFVRLDIFRRGIISALIQPLQSANPKVQTKVAQVVATYVNGADSRAEVSNC